MHQKIMKHSFGVSMITSEFTATVHVTTSLLCRLFPFLFFPLLSSDVSLPVGGGQGTVALYRTEGSFLHSVSLSTSPDRVRAGKTFALGVSGNLAGRPDQPTGQPLLKMFSEIWLLSLKLTSVLWILADSAKKSVFNKVFDCFTYKWKLNINVLIFLTVLYMCVCVYACLNECYMSLL